MARYAIAIALLIPLAAAAQSPSPREQAATILKPARVFDGEAVHEGWAVRVEGDRIRAAGPVASVSAAGASVVDLPGTTLLPGLVEGHSHVLLHPYNETKWDDQVLHESLGVRTARAVTHLRATLMAGFTTIRDLGTEGAGYADAELKQAVEEGVIPGPRMLVSTRAIVATEVTARKDSPLSGGSRRVQKKPTTRRWFASFETKSDMVRTGSRCMRTIDGARAERPPRRSRSRS